MNILVATASFNNGITARDAGECIIRGAKRIYPKDDYTLFPLADGGRGTVEAIITMQGGEYVECDTFDPLGRPIRARYGILADGAAVIEAASASALDLLSGDERNPLGTSSYGTGIMMMDAIRKGVRNIYLALGDSDIPDGGWGMAKALGIRFLDSAGRMLSDGAESLVSLERIDPSFMSTTVKNASFRLLTDMQIPLTGENGAERVYSTDDTGDTLSRALSRYREILMRDWAFDPDSISGSGAAGGMTCPLLAFTSATKTLKATDYILFLSDFAGRVNDADLVITGEDRLGRWTAESSLPYAVIKRAQSHRQYKDIVVIGNTLEEGYEKLYGVNVEVVVTALERRGEQSREDSMNAIMNTSESVFRIIRMAMSLKTEKGKKSKGILRRKNKKGREWTPGMKERQSKPKKPLYSPKEHVPASSDHEPRKRGRPRKTSS